MDLLKKSQPTICCDILGWNYKAEYPPGHFSVIAASVPCEEYSQAKQIGTRKMEMADRLVAKVLEIVEYFQPETWWIEHPRHGRLKNREVVEGIPFVDADYCQYSDWGYKKPTRFWGSKNLVGRAGKLCHPAECKNCIRGKYGKFVNRERLGGKNVRMNKWAKGRIPERLVDALLGLDEKSVAVIDTKMQEKNLGKVAKMPVNFAEKNRKRSLKKR